MLLILTLLFVVLLYVCKNTNESFTELDFYRTTRLYDKPKVKLQYYDGTNQYVLLDKLTMPSVLDDNNYKDVQPNNDKLVDTHANKNWNIKEERPDFGIAKITREQVFTGSGPVQKQILQEVKEESIPLELVHNNNNYNYIGKAHNNYYNQHYLLYERLIRNTPVVFDNKFGDFSINELEISTNKDNLENLNYQIYEYILVENKNNKMNVIYNFTPRNKINPYDVVQLSLGVLKIGPLLIKE